MNPECAIIGTLFKRRRVLRQVPAFVILLALSIPHALLFAKDPFTDLNPPLTPQMQKARERAIECKNPAIAEEKFDKSFRYGCFCGEDYPKIEPTVDKPVEELTYTERKALIARYYAIKPYDTIDAACQSHDICYIYNGEDSQECNDAFYRRMQQVYDAYDKTPEGGKPGTKAWRCRMLASDLSAIFKTIFTAGDDISASRFSIFAMITPFTIANKIVRESALTFSERSGYPLPHERCNIDLNETEQSARRTKK